MRGGGRAKVRNLAGKERAARLVTYYFCLTASVGVSAILTVT